MLQLLLMLCVYSSVEELLLAEYLEFKQINRSINCTRNMNHPSTVVGIGRGLDKVGCKLSNPHPSPTKPILGVVD